MRRARDFLRALAKREPQVWLAEGGVHPARISITTHEDGRLSVGIPFGKPLASHIFLLDEEDMGKGGEQLADEIMSIWLPIREKLVADMAAKEVEEAKS